MVFMCHIFELYSFCQHIRDGHVWIDALWLYTCIHVVQSIVIYRQVLSPRAQHCGKKRPEQD